MKAERIRETDQRILRRHDPVMQPVAGYDMHRELPPRTRRFEVRQETVEICAYDRTLTYLTAAQATAAFVLAGLFLNLM